MKRFVAAALCALATATLLIALRGKHAAPNVVMGRDSSTSASSAASVPTSSPPGDPSNQAARNPAQAIALIANLPPGDSQRDFAHRVVNDLLENDPQLAADFVTRLPSPLNWQMAAALASAWAQKDTPRAVEWATNLPSCPIRSHALFSLSAHWADADPRAAAAFVVNCSATDLPLDPQPLSDPDENATNRIRSQMLEIIAAGWVARDAPSARAWAAKLPPGDSRDAFIAGLVSSLAETSPAESAELVASMTPGLRQDDAALTVLLEWGRTDLPAAADWLKLFPSGDFRDKALLNLAANSTEHDADSVHNFLLNWPEPFERIRAVRHYLTTTLSQNAAPGAGLLGGIQDDALFYEETEHVAQHWLMQDPDAARQWILVTDLDDSVKSRLLTTTGPP